MFIEYRSGRGIVIDWTNDDRANPTGPAAASLEPPGLFEFISRRRVRLFTFDAFPLAEPVSLVTAHALHGHTAESLVLTTGGALTVADALHGHTADAVVLSVTAVLAAADALHGHLVDAVVLTTGGVLTVADALHGHTADAVVLTVTAVITVADALHGHLVDAVVLTTGNVLAVADALHGHTADAVVLTVNDVFVIADGLHGHTAESLALTLGDIALVISDTLHAHRAEIVRLSGPLTTLSEIIPALLNHLVDGRVWESATPDDLPRLDGRILPFVIWTTHGGSDAEYVEQVAPSHSHARVQLHAVAPGGITVERLIKDVRDALLASAYTVGVYGSPVGTYDPARKLKGRRQQFSLWFHQ